MKTLWQYLTEKMDNFMDELSGHKVAQDELPKVQPSPKSERARVSFLSQRAEEAEAW